MYSIKLEELEQLMNKYYYYYFYACEFVFVMVELYICKIEIPNKDKLLSSDKHLTQCWQIWQNEIQDEKLA